MFDPVAQDPSYFLFADQRTMIGVANFMNVMSNLPFLIVGFVGLRVLCADVEAVAPAYRAACIVFFSGVFTTAFGSGYFHLRPDNESLVWDRLPMTIGFMSLVSIVISAYISRQTGQRALLPLLLLGAISVAYWAFTESIGAGDLRAYAVVQFLPMLLIPMIIFLYRSHNDLGRFLWWMIGFYVAAKVAEQLDERLFEAGNLISGHTLKHLLASLAPASLIYGIKRRQTLRAQAV
jgi:hypothetical protein